MGWEDVDKNVLDDIIGEQVGDTDRKSHDDRTNERDEQCDAHKAYDAPGDLADNPPDASKNSIQASPTSRNRGQLCSPSKLLPFFPVTSIIAWESFAVKFEVSPLPQNGP